MCHAKPLFFGVSFLGSFLGSCLGSFLGPCFWCPFLGLFLGPILGLFLGPFLGLVLGPFWAVGAGGGAFTGARRARARRGGPGPAPQYPIQGVCAIPPLGGGFSQNPHPTPPPPPCSEESGNPRGQRQIPPSARTELEARPPPPLGPLQPPLGCLCVLHEFEVMARRTLGRQRRDGRGVVCGALP